MWPIRIIQIILGLVLVVVAARLVWVQAVRGSDLRQQAADSRVMPHVTPTQRGGIYDRNGVPLALSQAVFDIVIDPANIHHKGRAAQVFADVLAGDVLDYYEQLVKPSHYAVIEQQILPEERELLEEYISDLPTATEQDRTFKHQMENLITFVLDYERIYPEGELAAQTLGWVQRDTGEGRGGIELYYNEVLKGKPGASTSERDVRGNLIPTGVQREMPAQPGQPLILTLDVQIQRYCDAALAHAVEAHEAKAGAILVMDVASGEILAASSYPVFDLNEYQRATEEEMRNRALIEFYEPGSTLKPITAAAALDSGLVTTESTFEVPYRIQIGPDEVSDAALRGTWPEANLTHIIAHSSNVGTTRVAFTMGREHLYRGFDRFGLTSRSALDVPAVYPGNIPAPEEWLDIELSNFSFGQGVAISPVMLTRAIGAIANKGMMVTPHLLKEAPGRDDVGAVWTRQEATTPATAQEVSAMMHTVMTRGTGSRIRVPGYNVAGKTGTSEKAFQGLGYTDAYIASFAGYFPYEDPQVIIFVMLDEPADVYYGSVVAGPVFAEVATYVADYLSIPRAH